MNFNVLVYRAHDPNWSFTPLSGDGASKYGGRFNPVGTPALFTSLTVLTALAEYQQGFIHRPQPVTLCAYNVNCQNIVDITDITEQNKYGFTNSDLACAWEHILSQNTIPPTWDITNKLIAQGVAGIIAPSFAPNSNSDAKNFILWDWSDELPHQIILIDDNNKLPKNQSSWK